MNIAERAKKIIAEQMGVSPADLKDETRLVEDLGGDSLDQVEVVMAIEDEFEIEIPNDEDEAMRTVGDIITWLTKNTSAQ